MEAALAARREKKYGAGCRTRTGDLMITNQLLYQLSQAGASRRINISPPAGIYKPGREKSPRRGKPAGGTGICR